MQQTASIARAVERLPLAAGDPDPFYLGLADLLSHNGMPWVGACWHLTDPATGLFAWTGAAGDVPGDFVGALELEYLVDDVAKYSELAGRRQRAAALTVETGGEPARSVRYREQLAPDGVRDEMRFAFVDGFGRWGSMGLFSERSYDAETAALAARIVPIVARRLRESVIAAATAEEGPPGVLLLDASDRVVSRDSRAAELLAGCAATSELPGAIHVLAAQARMGGAPARGRTVTRDGGWLAVDVTLLEGGETAGVAVVVREASAPSLIDVRLRAAGLTDREREIARALLRGENTAAIAGRLYLSPWTVQDHLKSVFAKTGVRSRREFVASWAFGSAGLTS